MSVAPSATRDASGGAPAVLPENLTMKSILEILVINVREVNSRKNPGQKVSIPEAQCVLRNDDGTVALVGVLIVPKALQEVAKPGLYTASFGLDVPSYGDQQGRIMAALTGLTPIERKMLSPSATGKAP